MKVSIVSLCACALALALGAPVASAATVHDEHRVCTANARWQLALDVFGNGHADVTYSNIVCDGRTTSFDADGARLATGPSAPVPSDGVFRMELEGLVTAVGAYIGSVSQDDLGMRGVLEATASDMKASLVITDTTDDGLTVVRKAEHHAIGTCGSFCYDTVVRNVHSEARAS